MQAVEMKELKCVLIDIEGTVCPIVWVKDVLFPYALRALPFVLQSQWSSPDLKPYIAAFPEEVRKTPEALREHVEDLTRRDVKVAALKNLQGYLWEDGYTSGEYSTPLFEDVVPALRSWKDDGKVLAIYSSGSVFAQKLLFRHVQVRSEVEESRKRKIEQVTAAEDVPVTKAAKGDDNEEDREASSTQDNAGTNSEMPKAEGTEHHETSEQKAGVQSTEDLSDMFVGWFDTVNAGLKTEPSSYSNIAKELRYLPEEILFLSDNVREVDAAAAAGLKSIVVDRPGNAPISQTDRARLHIAESFHTIDVDAQETDEANADE